MPLNPFGPRVDKILSEPPREISPGEAVSMYVRDHPHAELDLRSNASRHIREWLTLYFRTWRIEVAWSESGLMYQVTAHADDIRVNGERKIARAHVYIEQVEELSTDLDAWVACLEWVAVSLQHDIDLATTGEVAAAVSKLNKLARAVEQKRLKSEEEAAIESIKRSSQAS